MPEPLDDRSAFQAAHGRRRRRSLILLRVILTLLLLCFLVFGGRWAFFRFYTRNPQLVLTDVRLVDLRNEGRWENRTEHYSLAYVKKLLEKNGCDIGKSNLVDLDLEKLRHSLEKEPLLERVELRREFPRTLVVSLRERLPIAYLVKGSKIFACVDENLVLFPNALQSQRELPYIYHLQNLDRMQMGVPQGESIGLTSAVELICLVNRRTFLAETGYSILGISVDMRDEKLNCNLKPFPKNTVLSVKDGKYPNVWFPLKRAKMEGALERFDQIVLQNLQAGESFSFADMTIDQRPYTRK